MPGQNTQSYEPTLRQPRIISNPWVILLVMTLGFFMILLDTTIVNVGIPSIIDGLHASLDQILWILNGYILVYAVLLVTAGRLGDMVGPRKLFMLGLVIFTLSSAACGLAQDPAQLIAFRIIQGVGGAILTPQTLSIITSIFPPEKRGAAFGIWGACAGLAAVTGPTLGGFLTTSFSWRAIFYVNVPIGIIAVTLAFLLMPERDDHRGHRLDIVGVALASSGLFALVFGLIEGQRYQWGNITNFGAMTIAGHGAGLISVPSILLLSVILLLVFFRWESRQDEPLLPLSLFHDGNFTTANVVSMIVAFGMLGLFLPLTIFLQSVLGLSAEDAGIAIAPTALTSMFIAPFAGRLADRFGGKYILFAGLVIYAVGMGLVVQVASVKATGLTFTLPLFIAGIGMGGMFAPLVTVAMRNVSPMMAGAASGFLNTVRQVGAALGSSVVGAVLQNRLADQMHTQAIAYSSRVPVGFRSTFIRSFASSGGLQVGRGQTGSAHLPSKVSASNAHHLHFLFRQVFQHAYLNALRPSLALPIVFLFLGAVITLSFVKRTPQARDGRAPVQATSIGAAAE